MPPSDETSEPLRLPDGLPEGPALLYVHSAQLAGEKVVTWVDQGGLPLPGGLTDRPRVLREKALLRALLEHTLVLLKEDDDGA